MRSSRCELRSFSSRWSWMTWANNDDVSTAIHSAPTHRGLGLKRRIVTPFGPGSRLGGDPPGGPRGGDDAVLAAPLRVVERGVGGREELGAAGGGRERRDAEARGDRDRGAVGSEDDPRRQRAPDPLGDECAALHVGAGQDEQELLPTPARGQVDVSERVVEDDAELAQHAVARLMAVAVVDVLEVVEVGENDGERAAEPFDARDL